MVHQRRIRGEEVGCALYEEDRARAGTRSEDLNGEGRGLLSTDQRGCIQ